MNAISETMRVEIPVVLARAEADDHVRVIVFGGNGERAFCAGADVKGFSGGIVGEKSPEPCAHTLDTGV